MKIFKLSLFTLPLVLFLVLTPHAHAAISTWQKGASMVPKNTTDFASSSFQQSLQNLASTHANSVSLILPYYQSSLNSSDIQPGYNTQTDAALITGIDYAKSLGFKVILKPHLECFCGTWRANINASDRTSWFANYSAMLNHLGTIGQAHGVYEIVIGSELIDMASGDINADNTTQWQSMISSLRKVYSGKLTYSANWGNCCFAYETPQIKFWGSLDEIGISAYYELPTSTNNPSDIEAYWDSWNNDRVRPLSQQYGKPVVFSEVGYRSVSGARYQPWNYYQGGGYDGTEQANLYTALFEYWNQFDYMQGVSLWAWDTDPNAGWPGNTDYTPQHKPAQDVMTQWFGSNTPTPPPPPASCPAAAANSFTGCYFDNIDLTNLKLTRTDPGINFDWGNGSPDPSVGPDTFSAQWQGNFSFDAATYNFSATADDGIRVWIDNNLVLDKWIDQPATTYNFSQTMAAGSHLIQIKYYENMGGAVAKFSWSQGSATTPPPPPPAGTCSDTPGSGTFKGCYFDNIDLTGFKIERADSGINFDWGNGSPDPSVGPDTFSAQWLGNFNFSAANYSFSATTDDGMRVWIDNTLVLDKWFDQPSATYNFSQTMTSGNHLVKVQYYENMGGAVAKFSWMQGSNSTPPPPPPPSTAGPLDIWWPSNSGTVQGVQPFKAMVENIDVSQYNMYWQVDGGGLNAMSTNYTDYPHKESLVDVSGWNWRGNGPYTVNFVAKDLNGSLLLQKSISIYVQH